MLGTADETALTAQKPRRRVLRRHKPAPMTHTRPRCVTVVVSAAVFALFVIAIAAAASRCCSPTDTPTKRDGDNATRQAAEKKKPPHPSSGVDASARACHGGA